MYVWHKYWSRKTWNVVGEFIKCYTREQEVVFDPFAGSGVVAVEAVRNGRRAIVCDLNPSASMITEDRFRKIVLETCREVMAERAEPTPYTLLINYVDPKLARLGFFGTLDTGLDIKKVLDESVGKEFKLVSTR